jgi:glycosyltransferase involved in cell wall biosynthesis
VLFVTGHAPPDRLGAFRALHEREDVTFAFFGGRLAHGARGAPEAELEQLAHLRVSEREVHALAASGRYRAVVAGTAGRLALPGAWLGARRAGVPFLLWSALWSQPRSPAHVLSTVLLRRLYAHADAVVTYGEHVSAYVRARGARNVHIAVQAVDNHWWAAPSERSLRPAGAEFVALFVGRCTREKGQQVLIEAWRASGFPAPATALVLVGAESGSTRPPAGGAVAVAPDSIVRAGPQGAAGVRNFYAAADVLVVPSIVTSTFREPWGLVVNEAFNQKLAVIASDAVGAVAGGLVRHERNGLVVPAGDAGALAGALGRLRADPDLAVRLGRAGAEDVRAYTHERWAQGFSAALASVGAARERW